MFALAIQIGIYSYLIFLLGVLGMLQKNTIVLTTIAFTIAIFFYWKKRTTLNLSPSRVNFKKNKFIIILVSLVSIQAMINLIGAFGPELAFDALWYHLTIPKIWLENNKVFYIPGGLLYYSTMPKLLDTIYISALAFQGEILAKLIHYSFGILILVSLYRFSKKKLTTTQSLLVLVIFYSNLVVAWESITAYIDLARTFFELLALYAFLSYSKTKKTRSLIKSSTMLGLATATKLLALTSLPIYIILIIYTHLPLKKNILKITKHSTVFTITTLIIPFPWLLFSYINTGNPVYPFFSETYPVSVHNSLFDISSIVTTILNGLLFSPDPVSPIYLISIPLILLAFKKFSCFGKMLTVYSIFALAVWHLTPQTGGGRFLLPHLPAFSVLVVYTIKKSKNDSIKKIFIATILFVSIITIFYRAAANARYLPVLLKAQSKHEFLSNNLNFEFGDYYDTDKYIQNNIPQNSNILVLGIHNLYYVRAPFIHGTYVTSKDRFEYILVGKSTTLPQKFSNWDKIHRNKQTGVTVYKKR